jgi:release factor glutamine methyltransferase
MVREGSPPLNEFAKIDEVLASAVETLQAASDSPRLDAELLLALALDVPRSYLYAHPEDELDPAANQRYAKLIDRRQQGQPMAYITGEKEFWSLTLMVSPDTLVPRPETEILVERALREIPHDANWKVLDLGTGSGAIALAIASERKHCDVVAVDVSAGALAIARQNARQLEIPNITFLQGDWTEPVQERKFDLIVSNPPYVRSGHAALDKLTHEPPRALLAGDDGLDAIRQLAVCCKTLLESGQFLIIEHGDDQETPVANILCENGWSPLECLRDLAGKPRITVASLGQ